MREKHIEQAFANAAKQAGLWPLKLTCPGTAGMPDRIVLSPNAKVTFVELKAPGKKPRPLQTHRHEQLRRLGFTVITINRLDQIHGAINEILSA